MATPTDLGVGLQLIAQLFAAREVEADRASARITEEFAARHGSGFVAYLDSYGGVEEFEADLAHIYNHSVLNLHERESVVVDHVEARYQKGERLRGAYLGDDGGLVISSLEEWYPSNLADSGDESWLGDFGLAS